MKIQNLLGTVTTEVEPGLQAVRAEIVNQRGIGYCASCMSGTIAASLATGSPLWYLRVGHNQYDSGLGIVLVDRIRLKATVIVGGVAGSATLGLFRGAGSQIVAGSGGAAVVPTPKRSLNRIGINNSTTPFSGMRMATTGALSITSITWESTPLRQAEFKRANILGAGAFDDYLWEFHETEDAPVAVQPFQFLAIRATSTWPGTQTWQLQVDVDYREVPFNPETTN